MIFPTMYGCSAQKYRYSPGAAKVCEKLSPVSSAPDRNDLSSATISCTVASAFFHVIGVPAVTVSVDGPQRQMGHDHDRRARRKMGDILLQPVELLVAKGRQSRRLEPRLEIEDVEQANEVHAGHVEAVPAFAARSFAVIKTANKQEFYILGEHDVADADSSKAYLARCGRGRPVGPASP